MPAALPLGCRPAKGLPLNPAAPAADPQRWLEQIADARDITDELRLALETFDCDQPRLRTYVRSWADVVALPSFAEVPELLRGVDPTADCPELASSPFSFRDPIPKTPPIPAPKPQHSTLRVRGWHDLLTEESMGRVNRTLGDALTELVRMSKFDVECIRGLQGRELELFLTQWRAFSTPCIIGRSGFKPGVFPTIWDMRAPDADGYYHPVDFNAPLESHLDLPGIRDYLSKCRDRSVVDMVTLRGCTFSANVEYQLVILPHLISMPPGFALTSQELTRLEKEGYLSLYPFLPFCPWRTIQQGCVPRPLEALRPRRISNASGVHYVLLDDDGRPYVPLNVAINHRGRLPGPYRFENATVAISGHFGDVNIQRPRQSHRPNTVWAPEIKPRVKDLLADMAILQWAGRHVFHLPLLIFNDDMKDAFNQLPVAPEDWWKMGFVWARLQPLGGYVIACVAEFVLGFGYTTASGICQRYMEAVCERLTADMNAEDQPLLAVQAEMDVAVKSYLETRNRTAMITGRVEAQLFICKVYSDDPVFAALGVARLVRLLSKWGRFIIMSRHRMAIPEKRQIGLRAKWLGLQHWAYLGVTVVPKQKAFKLCHELKQVIDGVAPTRQSWKRTAGLCGHVKDALCLPREALYHIYGPLDTPGDPGSNVIITDRLRSACVQLHERISSCPGGSCLAAFEQQRAALPFIADRSVIMTSDAALRGTTSPGIGGYMHGFAWRLPLAPDDCSGRFELPISVLEFVGIGINMIEFPSVVPEPLLYNYIMGSDSDNSVGSLVDESSKSENMQQTCSELRSLAAYELHAERTSLAQIYGEGNVFADAISRGWYDYIASLERQFGIKLIWLELSAPSLAFFQRVRDGFRRDVVQRRRRLSAGNGVRTGEADHPGPSDGPSFSPTRSLSAPAAHSPASLGKRRAADICAMPSMTPPQAATSSSAAGPSFTPPTQLASNNTNDNYSSLAIPGIGTSRAGPSFSPPRAAPASQVREPATTPTPRARWSAPPTIPRGKGPAAARFNPLSSESWNNAHEELLSFMQNDTSDMALRPPDPTTIPTMVATVGSYVLRAVPPNSASKAESAWAHWSPVMAELGAAEWRKNLDLSGTTRESRMVIARECMLWLMALVMIWRRMRAKRRENTTAKPASALGVILAIRAAHRQHGYPVPDVSAMQKCLKGMKLEYVQYNGAAALLPHRKEPLTDDDVEKMLAAPDKATRGSIVVDWSSVLFKSFRALVLFLRKSAMRKADALSLADVSHPMDFMRSNITWSVGGTIYSAMSQTLRARMRPGDALIGRPAGSKADPLAEYFGANPIYLPYGLEPNNAAAAMADLELAAPCAEHERATTPAFPRNADNEPLLMSLADAIFAFVTSLTLGRRAPLVSLHSCRVYLACALKALGADDPTIQAICRWKTPESIKIYGRLTGADYMALVRRTASVTTSSVLATNAAGISPPVDDDSFFADELAFNEQRQPQAAAAAADCDVDGTSAGSALVPEPVRSSARPAPGAPAAAAPPKRRRRSTYITLRFVQANPKRPGSAAYARYDAYKGATTPGEFTARGGTAADLRHDVRKGYCSAS